MRTAKLIVDHLKVRVHGEVRRPRLVARGGARRAGRLEDVIVSGETEEPAAEARHAPLPRARRAGGKVGRALRERVLKTPRRVRAKPVRVAASTEEKHV
jgi:hypothetical protein